MEGKIKDQLLLCECCGCGMTEEDHNFCDICDDCRDEEQEKIRYGR